jgi:hypothetical protein
MKNSMIGLSLAITLLCGFLLFQKNREVEAARARLAAAEKQREVLAAEAAQLEKKSTSYQTRLHESRAEAFDKTVEAQELRQQLARIQTGEKDQEHKDLSGLFRDEAMKGVLKEEAKAGIARNIKTLFDAGLAQQLHLDDNQSATLKQLMTQKDSILWNQMLIPMTTGELDDAGMAAAGKGIKQALEENTAQTRALLGDEGYTAYQWFEKTQPERDRLKEFSSKVEQAGQDLSTGQQSELLAVMTDERVNFKFQFDLGDPAQLNFEHWDDNFTEERINAYFQDMEQLNDRIAQRARAVLTPEQSNALKDLLAQELAKAKFTIRTTTALSAKRR